MDLEAIGVVAELVPTSSPFKVGMRSRGSKTVKPFTIAGRLQLRRRGTWDEGAPSRTGVRWSPRRRAFWRMLPLKPPPVPDWTKLVPGQSLDLGAYGRYAVAEVREATYVSAEGDLPFIAPPGSHFRYADVSAADGSLGTLDYGDDPGLDGFYVGRRLELDDLGIEGLTAWKDRKASAKAQARTAPTGGAFPERSRTPCASRAHCGSLPAPRATGRPTNSKVLEALGRSVRF